MTQMLQSIQLPLSMNNSHFQEPLWGPTGREVYERTYQRVKADGTKESWSDTVRRVVKGNLSLVPSSRIALGEEEELYDLIYNFRAIPAGRHLWMSGVEGRQFLFNCYVSGWGDKLSDHFAFTFNQLMEGGGVGANYSAKHVDPLRYPIYNLVGVHVVCSEEHENYKDLEAAGLLSSEYTSDWTGAHEVDDSREGWTQALRELIDLSAQYQPENAEYDKSTGEYLPVIIFDVSNVRKEGSRIKTFGGTSAGPVPFARMIKGIGHLLGEAWLEGMSGPIAMEMDHCIATCVISGNVRRSARMSIMHWNDPWIDWFLKCKENGLSHWSTNISVEIDDQFIEYLNRPSNDGDPVADKARKVFDEIVDGMIHNGEPGIWNSSLSNLGEPNEVIATNPCGEIALEAWENCNLGHVNLDAFVMPDGTVDVVGLVRAHQLMARFLIRATFGDISDFKTQAIVSRNRRIGVGHFGYAGFVAKQGIRYSESYMNPGIRNMLDYLYKIVDDACVAYSHELRIPVPVKKTTVAPTGTIAKLAGRSEGIHPVFAKYFIRRIRYSSIDESQSEQLDVFRSMGYNVVEDPSVPYTWVVEIPTIENLVEEVEALGLDGEIVEDASQISIHDMLGVLDMYQTLWADNAVSFTVNFDSSLYTHQQIADELKARLAVLKGATLFPERGFALAPYQRVPKEKILALRGSQAVVAGDSVDEECTSGACPVR